MMELINISSRARYSLEAMFDLASHNRGEPVRIADIARRQKIPKKFLESILASLKQGGFVESRRGAEGGYFLARNPEAITIGEVLRFVEGSQAKTPASGRRETPFADLWWNVDQAISGIIDHASFAELLRKWADKQKSYVPDWEI
jgi:Rrf2 family protein